jgi:hypothetical protein
MKIASGELLQIDLPTAMDGRLEYLHFIGETRGSGGHGAGW